MTGIVLSYFIGKESGESKRDRTKDKREKVTKYREREMKPMPMARITMRGKPRKDNAFSQTIFNRT